MDLRKLFLSFFLLALLWGVGVLTGYYHGLQAGKIACPKTRRHGDLWIGYQRGTLTLDQAIAELDREGL